LESLIVSRPVGHLYIAEQQGNPLQKALDITPFYPLEAIGGVIGDSLCG
jgi:hypothetical protein